MSETKTERIAELEKEAVQAWGWVEVHEAEAAYLMDRLLKAEGLGDNRESRCELSAAMHRASAEFVPAAI